MKKLILKKIKIPVLIFLLCFSSTCRNETAPQKQNDETKKNQAQEKARFDLKELEKILQKKMINLKVQTPTLELYLPFHYSLDQSSSYLLLWKLCDLEINSESKGYSRVLIENTIPYRGHISTSAYVHLVQNKDKTAVTTEKFMEQHKKAYRKILYSDENSLIYDTSVFEKEGMGRYEVLYFKYIDTLKTYLIFTSEHKAFGFSASNQELLEQAFHSLWIAKNLLNKVPLDTSASWGDYQNALSSLEKKVFTKTIQQLKAKLPDMKADSLFSAKLDGNFELVTMIKGKNKYDILKKELKKYQKGQTAQPLLELLFPEKKQQHLGLLKKENNWKFLYKDKNGFIIKSSYDFHGRNYHHYEVFYSTEIQSTPVLLYTERGADPVSEQMAMFYFHLFKNINHAFNSHLM